MTRQVFIEKLQSIVDLGEDCKVLIYFVLNGVVKRANIKHEVLNAMASTYKETLVTEIGRFDMDAECGVLNLSDRDERSNVVYRYDLPDEEPTFFEPMRDVVAAHPVDYFTGDRMFCFDTDKMSDIDYFIIELGAEDNKIVIYRNNYNINLLKQAHGRYYLNKSGTQFTNVEEDILRMDSQIDVLKIDDDFLILNLSYLDNSKEFASIIKTRAEASLEGIAGLNLVDSIEGLRERLSELAFARRLMRAMDASPVTELPSENVISFVEGHEQLRNVLKVENGRIKLSTKKSQDYFIRLLNDDFLHSQLTSQDYTSTSKNKLRE